jgi:hypothetical protein
MHSFPDIHAVTKPSPFSNVAAALASNEYRSVARIAASARIEERLANGGPIPIAELDEALRKHDVGTQARIALKSALGRIGLLKE